MSFTGFALERADRLHEMLLRLVGFDGEKPVKELGHLRRTRAGNDLLAQCGECVECVLIEEQERASPDFGLRSHCRGLMYVRR